MSRPYPFQTMSNMVWPFWHLFRRFRCHFCGNHDRPLHGIPLLSVTSWHLVLIVEPYRCPCESTLWQLLNEENFFNSEMPPTKALGNVLVGQYDYKSLALLDTIQCLVCIVWTVFCTLAILGFLKFCSQMINNFYDCEVEEKSAPDIDFRVKLTCSSKGRIQRVRFREKTAIRERGDNQ